VRTPDKNRYLNAVRHVETEEVPFQEDEFDFSAVEKILGRPVPRVRSYELPVADMVELHLRAGNDLLYLAWLWELGRRNVIDADGRKHYVDGTIKTRRDLEGITCPELDAVRRRLEETLEAIEGTRLGLKYRPNQTPFLVMTAIGYEDYYIYLRTDPDFIHEFERRVNDFCLRELELALSYPVDVIQVSATFGSSMGPLISREMIEEFEYPSLRERISMIKARGVPVSLHVDGEVQGFIEDFIEMGVDVIHPVEPCGGRQDIYEIKRLYGDRIALHGNIDLAGVLVFGTPEDVARDVETHLERLAPGGGYVCGSSHDITEAVPIENFIAMRNTVHRWRYRYSNGRNSQFTRAQRSEVPR